ncbi:MAG TPA: hypothetical protein DIC56_06445 [Rhizobium sp.]|nr:hypothetical protein [Rhizobium sp.]
MQQDSHVCVLIAFPTERRVGLIRSTSRAILDRTKEAGERHMRMQCNRLYASLQAAGFDHPTICAEIDTFVMAVAREMERSHPQTNPVGAA